MGAKEWLVDKFHTLWRLASEVMKFESSFTWLESIYEDDEVRSNKKTIDARIRFLKHCLKIVKKEQIIKKLIVEDKKNGSNRNREKEDYDTKSISESKSDDI